MLAPAVMPVAAGKKMAKAIQKPSAPLPPGSEAISPWLAEKWLLSKPMRPPATNDATASRRMMRIGYCALTARSAPLKVRKKMPKTTAVETSWGTW